MKLALYLGEAAATARSSRNAAGLARDLIHWRTRLTHALHRTHDEDGAAVVQAYREILGQRGDVLAGASSRADLVRELTAAWLDAVEHAEFSSRGSVAELYAAAAANETDEDREFYDAAATAAGERWAGD